ncbi:MAG: hypothetical protein NT114_00365 [Patescibacteria group bacterium]|nr:hypothetical protein [Patescibacteria group bacterium]
MPEPSNPTEPEQVPEPETKAQSAEEIAPKIPTKTKSRKALFIGIGISLAVLILIISVFVLVMSMRSAKQSETVTSNTSNGLDSIISKIGDKIGVEAKQEEGFYHQAYMAPDGRQYFVAKSAEQSWKYPSITENTPPRPLIKDSESTYKGCRAAEVSDGAKAKLDQAVAIFVESGYEKKGPYSYISYDVLDCQGGYEVSNDANTCSVVTELFYSTDVGVNTKYEDKEEWSLKVGCVDASESQLLSENISEYYQINNDIGDFSYLKDYPKDKAVLIRQPKYLEDSFVNGYKIAEFELDAGGNLFAYKKGDGKWVEVKYNGGSDPCDTINADPELKKIFEGECS